MNTPNSQVTEQVRVVIAEMRATGQYQEVFGDRIHEWAEDLEAALTARTEADSKFPMDPDDERVNEIVSALYRRFKEWSQRKFSADDVTWCEVKRDVMNLILAAPPAAEEGFVVADSLRVIGELIRTQDNRITDSPIFIVQQKREHVSDADYDYDRIAWVSEDNTEISAEESAAAEEHFKAEYEAPEGLRRLAVRIEWEFVTACFTEQGCKDYLARDGHNLKEPRIYAAGSYRNNEFREVRKFLMSLAARPQPAQGDGCWCRTCRPITFSDQRFVVCPACGNKRCPKANDHRHDCTGSNETGQPGSAYPPPPAPADGGG